MKPVIGYTLGDQSGIGPEVISAALASGELPEDAEYRLIGKRVELPPGRPNAESAKHAFDHLEQAAHALRDGTVDAVVTAPVCKETLHEAGFRWPGQTEFFAERLKTDNYAMCLTGKRLTVGLATIHTSLQSVPSLLETEELVRIGTLLKDFCIRKGIMRPRIALAALNPHAGEHGAFGDEDGNIIAPAVGRLRAIHPDAAFDGPSVPDCVYRDAVEGNYDAVLAPYHDQGLIPLKLVEKPIRPAPSTPSSWPYRWRGGVNVFLLSGIFPAIPAPSRSGGESQYRNITPSGRSPFSFFLIPKNNAPLIHLRRKVPRLPCHDPFLEPAPLFRRQDRKPGKTLRRLYLPLFRIPHRKSRPPPLRTTAGNAMQNNSSAPWGE